MNACSSPLTYHIAKLQPFPITRDSGVDWVGELPSHWEMRRLKTLCNMKSGDGITEEQIEDAGDYPVYGGNGIRGYASSYNQDGTFVLIGRQGAQCGNTHVVRGKFWASEHAVVVTLCSEDSPRWLSFILEVMNLNQYSVSAAQPGLSVERLHVLPLPVPPVCEQSIIVGFLDYIDRRVRRYILVNQKQIVLLREQKQAVIHQAVTGQIDVRTGKPYPSYKASGVDWLSNIPVHWEMVRNGRLFVQRNEIRFPDLPIMEVSLKTGVRVRDFEKSGRKQAMSNRGDYKRVVKGDIAYNMMRMWQGAVGVTPVDGLVSPAYVVATALPGNDPRYFGSLFRTSAYMIEVDKYSRGIVKDRNRLYWEDFKQMPSPCPPPDEQVLIADAIDRNAVIIGEAIQQVERQIDVVNEYRTRLIADVVTGKLDVRSAVIELPREDSFGCAGESAEESTVEREVTV